MTTPAVSGVQIEPQRALYCSQKWREQTSWNEEVACLSLADHVFIFSYILRARQPQRYMKGWLGQLQHTTQSLATPVEDRSLCTWLYEENIEQCRTSECQQVAKMLNSETTVSAGQVTTSSEQETVYQVSDTLSMLYSSDSDGDSVRHIRVNDRGSWPRSANVLIKGVSAAGVINTGADVIIVNGSLFTKIATAATLKQRDFQHANKVTQICNQQCFKLDGRMNLDITFGDRTMYTPVFIKMDAHAPYFYQKECMCNQLGIVVYHQSCTIKARKDLLHNRAWDTSSRVGGTPFLFVLAWTPSHCVHGPLSHQSCTPNSQPDRKSHKMVDMCLWPRSTSI